MEAPQQAPKAAAGWYPHPSMVDTQRYWDGQRWTDHIAPATPARDYEFDAALAQAGAPPEHGGLVAAGYITALLLPLVGFIIGIVLLWKRPGHGVAAMVLSVMAFVFWFEQLTPDYPTTSYYGY